MADYLVYNIPMQNILFLIENTACYVFGLSKTWFYVDTPEKAFYRELAKVIEASDVILEVLDARDPLGTRCADIEKMVLKAGPQKQLVLLLNKIGICHYLYKCNYLLHYNAVFACTPYNKLFLI